MHHRLNIVTVNARTHARTGDTIRGQAGQQTAFTINMARDARVCTQSTLS